MGFGLALTLSLLASACGAGTATSSTAAGSAGTPSASSAGSATPAKGGAPAATLTPISIAIPTAGGTTSIPLFVARDLHIFERHGLQVTIPVMSNEGEAMAALTNGNITFTAAIGSAVRAAERGLPIQVVMDFANRPPFLLIGDEGVSRIEDLRGKTVALYSPGSTGTLVGTELLAADGLKSTDYHVTYAGADPAHVALLRSHKVAATLLSAPVAVPLIDAGFPLLENATKKIQLPEAGLAASTAEIRRDPQLVRRTVAALLDAMHVLVTQKSAVEQVMTKELKLPPADAAKGYDLLAGVWNEGGRPTQAALDFEFRTDMQSLKLKAPPQADALYNLSFLPATPNGGGKG